MKKNQMNLPTAKLLTAKEKKAITGGGTIIGTGYYCNDEDAACTALYGSLDDCELNCAPEKCSRKLTVPGVCVG